MQTLKCPKCGRRVEVSKLNHGCLAQCCDWSYFTSQLFWLDKPEIVDEKPGMADDQTNEQK